MKISATAPLPRPAGGTFRSLRIFNFRVWAIGALVSDVGTWMQRTAQDWLVLTHLTHNNATSVGIVMALQYGPHLIMLPWSGFAADRFDRRKLLIVTQAVLGALALVLGVLTVTGWVRLWEVYVLALLLGTASAFDSPARQTFVGDLVGETDLSNAVALHSTSFNAARMLGPAVAGVMISAIGTGWVFIVNGLSYLAVLASLVLLRGGELHFNLRAEHARGGVTEGLRYVWRRRDLRTVLIMLFLIGTFGLNFPIFISAMAVKEFAAGAGGFGLLMSMLAIGTIAGSLLAARRERPRMRHLLAGALVFGCGCALAAIMPTYGAFGGSLLVIGFSALTFTTSTNSLMQLASEPVMRGRVMAIRLAIAVGCTPIGAPIIGWVADRFGARWSLAVGAASGFAAAAVAIRYLRRSRKTFQASSTM